MSKIDHVLKRVGLTVLENWAMMMVDEVNLSETEIFWTEEPLFISSMHFEGVMNGTISIVAPRAFMDTLAHNLLGADSVEVIGDQEKEDAFKEMANVLLGNFLTEAYGDDVVFALVQPRISTIAATEFEHKVPGRTVYHFLADGKPVALTFNVDG